MPFADVANGRVLVETTDEVAKFQKLSPSSDGIAHDGAIKTYWTFNKVLPTRSLCLYKVE